MTLRGIYGSGKNAGCSRGHGYSRYLKNVCVTFPPGIIAARAY